MTFPLSNHLRPRCLTRDLQDFAGRKQKNRRSKIEMVGNTFLNLMVGFLFLNQLHCFLGLEMLMVDQVEHSESFRL